MAIRDLYMELRGLFLSAVWLGQDIRRRATAPLVPAPSRPEGGSGLGDALRRTAGGTPFSGISGPRTFLRRDVKKLAYNLGTGERNPNSGSR